MDELRSFIRRTAEALAQDTFHKLALGKPGPKAQGLLSASGRLVELKDGPRLSLVLRTARQEETRNLPLEDLEKALAPLLGEVFRQADLYTSGGSFHLLISKKGSAVLLEKKTVVTAAPQRTHDRQKVRRMDLSQSPWARALGLVDSQGKPLAAMKDKIHQMEKFLELVDHQTKGLENMPELKDRPLRAADLGAGKGYLTFALYQWLTQVKGLPVDLEAVEVQEDLCTLGNRAAEESGYTGLKFIPSRIDQTAVKPRDLVIVLHACDTATDDALALGIRSGARWIFAAPCCHQELRKNLTLRGGMESILRHGILLERQVEILTDGLRSLVLESAGYTTKVQEFVPAEHSGKNLLITARLKDSLQEGALRLRDEKAAMEIQRLKQLFGLERVYLEALLELEDLGDLTPVWRHLGPVARESLAT